MIQFTIIAAMDKNQGIGYKNQLPWPYIREDMIRFMKITKGKGNNCVIMGKNTYLSIGKPLLNRVNIVISTTLDLLNIIETSITKINSTDTNKEGIQIVSSLDDALLHCEKENYDNIYIIGGAVLYNHCINDTRCKELLLTLIDDEYDCDVYFPDYKDKYTLVESTTSGKLHYNRYVPCSSFS